MLNYIAYNFRFSALEEIVALLPWCSSVPLSVRLTSVGLGADTLTVSPHVTLLLNIYNQTVRCHYFPPGQRLPSMPKSSVLFHM